MDPRLINYGHGEGTDLSPSCQASTRVSRRGGGSGGREGGIAELATGLNGIWPNPVRAGGRDAHWLCAPHPWHITP